MRRPLADDELEATLRDIGRRLDHPAPAHMALAVRERIRAARETRGRRLARLGLLPGLATAAVLLLVIAFGLPTVRAAADELLRLRGIDIFRVPAIVSPAPSPVLPLPGDRTTLDDARRRMPFAIRVPTFAALGAPDDVYVVQTGAVSRVALVYGERPGLPRSQVAGVSALVVELRGTLDAQLLGKAIGPETRVEQVTVNGARGYWLEGAPHLFFYRDIDGSVRDETLRLAGNTLVWEEAGVTYRLEAQVSREEALRIAASFR